MTELDLAAPPASSAGSCQGNDSMNPVNADEAAIWAMIEAEHVSFWSLDYTAEMAFHTQAREEQFWAWTPSSGVTIWGDGDAVRRGLKAHFKTWPEPSPYMISRVRRENRVTRIVGDVAWVTFDEVFATDDLPGYSGPSGCVHQMRIVERQAGVWKLAFMSMLDEQFGQTETPTWQIDRDGRILLQNPAATAHLKQESEIVVRAGRLRMRDKETDLRLYDVIRRTVDPPGCMLFGSDAAPVVYDPGNDSPAHIWWVVARSGKLSVSFNDPGLVRNRIEMAARALGLSPSQQRLTMSIAGGLAITEAAKREGIRVSTARTQLQRIYDKVGVRAQPALVHALLSATNPAQPA